MFIHKEIVAALRSIDRLYSSLYPQIGSWSRWLTDLFGIDDTDVPDDEDELSDHKGQECDTSFKPFRLLNALSDLMMLPSEMLADKSTRAEVNTWTKILSVIPSSLSSGKKIEICE